MDSPLLLGKEPAMIAVAYALGCFCAGYYLVRFRTGKDIRTLGSGSTGGRNAGRALGIPGFVVTMLGDAAKGAAAVLAALWLNLDAWGVASVLVAVVLGHIWPIQLGFRGGKGLSPALGAILALDWRLATLLTVFTGVLGVLTRQYCIAAMLTVAIMPAVASFLGHEPATVAGLAFAALAILMAHRRNILAIFPGERRRVAERSQPGCAH